MDKVTAAVRAFYETYPYPSGDDALCDGYHGRLLLSYLERPQGAPRSLGVLEAGCGRGVNLSAVAARQQQDRFTGIDINRVAIDEAARTAAQRGLDNLDFQVANLLDSASLPEVEEGYDVILSYGVLHHLSDPVKGLRQLRERLAPQGVIGLMVDGSYGRQPLDRYLEALEIIEPAGLQRPSRRTSAQALARAAEQGVFKGNYWQGTASVNEVEFADRCLHVHEMSYDITGLWRLLGAAGLRFIRWQESSDWCLEGISEEPQLAARLQALDPVDLYRVIERLAYRPKLTLVAARQEDSPRKAPTRDEVSCLRFVVNPQLGIHRDEQGAAQWRLRCRPVSMEPGGWEEEVVAEVGDSAEGLSARTLLERLAESGLDRDQGVELIHRMHVRELLYSPHRHQQALS